MLKVIALSILISIAAVGSASCDGVALCDVSDLAGWQGLKPDPALSRNGAPTARWDHAEAGAARTESIPHDWSAYNSLEFAMHSARATGAEFMLILASETGRTEGSDYFSMPIALDWTGWRTFSIPFNEFPRTREPVGWRKIDSITFTAEGWGNHPNPESVVHIADLKLARHDGPGISDAELFRMLDLNRPGLEKVKNAADAGDLAAAKHEFAEYLRHRDNPKWKWDWHAQIKPTGNANTSEADRIMRRDLPSVGVYHQYEGEIDWNLKPIDYLEWPWQLNRHPFWVTLGRAYRATGDEKYAREFVYQMTDWVRKCNVPRYTSGNSSCTWRTIEAGIRTGQTWPEAYHLFLTSPSFTDDAIVAMVKSFAEHARHLVRWPTTGNWLAMEANGLMHVGVMFPEFKESAGWRKTATDRLYGELDRQVYPDGAQIELTTGYHQVSLRNFVMAWEIAHINDVPMPADYVAKIERMYDYNLNASMPDGALPGLNDANRTDIRGSLQQALTFFPDRKDYQWVATGGKQGERPKTGSIALPFSGQLIMRSGWDPSDLYLLMDAGPFGYGHQHEDALSFVIYAHGKYHLVDPGNYAYDSSQWRKYVLSTRAHNTIMVDGQDQHRRGRPREQYVLAKPLPNRWASSDAFDYASGTYSDGYGPHNDIKVTHTRSVFFVKPEYWIVADLLDPADGKPHRYDSMFHLDAGSASVDEATKAVRTANKDGANLAIVPMADQSLAALVISGQEEPVVQGWMPWRNYECRPIPTPVYSREASGDVGFVYVFYPTPAGKKCPVTGVEPVAVDGGKGVAAAVRFAGGRVDYFVRSYAPGTKLAFAGFETDAEAACIRTDGGRVTGAMRAGGTYTKKAGKPIETRSQPVGDLSQTDTRHVF